MEKFLNTLFSYYIPYYIDTLPPALLQNKPPLNPAKDNLLAL